MAGKHSKKFSDSIKEIKFNIPNLTKAATNKASILLKIVIAVLVSALLMSAIWIASFFVSAKSNQKILSEAAEIFDSNESSDALKILYGQNNDIKAWLKIDGTDINYAVCQGENDQHYINYNQLGKKSRFGALFLSSDDNLKNSDNDHNKVIFGNNMKDGSMFGSLKKYRNINFYRRNPVVNFYYEDKKETYIVLAVMLVSSFKNDGKEMFNPTKSYFENKSVFDEWYAEVCKRSLIKTDIEVAFDDDLLSLVTLADDFEGARLVVVAKRLEGDEISHIDTSTASVNPKTKYPKIWYTTKGLKYPY